MSELGWITAITASRIGGAILCLGGGLAAEQAVAGLQGATKFLCAIEPDDEPSEMLTKMLTNDIRCILHRQNLDAFIGDIGHHRFDVLIVTEAAMSRLNSATIEQLSPMVNVTGFAITPSALTLLSEESESSPLGIYRLTTRTMPKPKRRGGRNAKRDPMPSAS